MSFIGYNINFQIIFGKWSSLNFTSIPLRKTEIIRKTRLLVVSSEIEINWFTQIRLVVETKLATISEYMGNIAPFFQTCYFSSIGRNFMAAGARMTFLIDAIIYCTILRSTYLVIDLTLLYHGNVFTILQM